jgi:Zn-dependent peptidase ImmA (M78 family)
MLNEHDLRGWLRKRAEELRPDASRLDIDALLRSMAIKVRRVDPQRTSIKDGETHGAASRGYEIVCVGSAEVRSRFTLAHELGHVLLDRDLDCRPLTKTEYWKHEVICNDFAARLLIPESAVADLPRKSPWRETDGVAREYDVSWEVAARRITEVWPQLSVIAGRLTRNRAGERVFLVQESCGREVSGIAVKRHIAAGTLLGDLLFRMAAGEEWSSRARDLWSDARVETIPRKGAIWIFIAWEVVT